MILRHEFVSPSFRSLVPRFHFRMSAIFRQDSDVRLNERKNLNLYGGDLISFEKDLLIGSVISHTRCWTFFFLDFLNFLQKFLFFKKTDWQGDYRMLIFFFLICELLASVIFGDHFREPEPAGKGLHGAHWSSGRGCSLVDPSRITGRNSC